jgi:hypothetical protein
MFELYYIFREGDYLLSYVCQLLDITQQIPIRHPFGLKNSAEILHPTEKQTIFMGLYAQ